ncbi:hypothetical protein P43SY_009930 [Pythium insidiosum]|uniref:Myb-like DNA-binding protein n=1 Tax=Pythium insidiosum TaxID=114742 RepID=A0AAD5QAA1_PYTIN|nr:hypothetical protein P43SY_009930 [Pythium insidiosum]
MASSRQNDADLLLSALAANRAYAEELERSIRDMTDEERELMAQMKSLRQRLAQRRADRAMAKLGCRSQEEASTSTAVNGLSVFDREPENRYKRVGVVPRSFIRQKPSFFHASPERKAPGRPPKRPRLTPAAAAALGEPTPNADTVYLRQHSHEAFLATPSKVFSAKEREVVKAIAQQYMSETGKEEIPLSTWNAMVQTAKPRIHRSGFACKLRWELHDNPSLRLGAWTKAEDAALKALASGEVDPSIVNNWAEIAKRMPLPGRPPVHCLIRYQTKLCSSNLNEKFTPEEDALLRQGVEVFGERWTIIADLMDGRIAEQLRHRWQLSLSPNVKLGKFSVIEDRRLLLALFAYHDRDEVFNRDAVAWHQICHHIPGRPPPPVRDRFLNSLNPEVTFRPWTKQEDDLIVRTVTELGFDGIGLWPRLAAELGNRTDNQVARRARYIMAREYREHQQRKLLNKGDEALPVIFRRPTMRRKVPNSTSQYERRSSYRGEEVEVEAEVDMDTAESTEQEQENDQEQEQEQEEHTCAIREAEELTDAHTRRSPNTLLMDALAITSTTVRRTTISSRGASRSGSGSRLLKSSQWKLDESAANDDDSNQAPKPVFSSKTATRCYRPKEWTPEVEEAFRVQQTGWRDLKEYMESYGEPERWTNGFIRCTRVKSNGYYTYWRPHRECDDKYLHTVKVFEYA